MTKKYNYLVPFYFGDRMNVEYNKKLKKNKFFFADKHFDFLQNYKNNNIEKIIIIVNQTPNDNLEEIQEYFLNKSKNISDDIEVNLLFRENTHFSYGAWNHAIIDDINSSNENGKYYFCFEEDYIATSDNFITPFMEKCNENVPYICSKAVINHEIYIDHASMSIGIFSKEACKKVYEKNGYVFLLKGDNSYTSAWNIQQTFYKSFIDMGYKISDLMDDYTFPFLCSATNEVKTFGNFNNKVFIAPIIV